MLGSIRKFSGSIYAKILLGIIIIPFVFWGMGSSFVGGSKNVVVVIEDEKYSIVEESGDKKEVSGDDIIKLPDGSLTTVYHYLGIEEKFKKSIQETKEEGIKIWLN